MLKNKKKLERKMLDLKILCNANNEGYWDFFQYFKSNTFGQADTPEN